MPDPTILGPAALRGLAAAAVLAFLTWVASLAQRDVSLVDRGWSFMILGAGLAALAALPHPGPRTMLMVALAAIWAVRLSFYITWRNWGHGEDRRYQAIRARNEPHFPLKSLYLVFALQAVLAWLVSLPMIAAFASARPFNVVDAAGIVVFVVGFVFETVGDAELAAFKAKASNRGLVMDRGLWRYTRHPNYFGEFCVWWGLFLIALAAGGWWSIASPIVMSVLLLRVSGVTLLEQDIGERRPAYRDYIARTNAFFPGAPKPPRSGAADGSPG